MLNLPSNIFDNYHHHLSHSHACNHTDDYDELQDDDQDSNDSDSNTDNLSPQIEKDFLAAERAAQKELIRQEKKASDILDFERKLLIRQTIKDIFYLIQSGNLSTPPELKAYLAKLEATLNSRFTLLGQLILNEMEKIALTRQYFYITHQTETDLIKDIDRLRAVQKRFFTDFKSIPKQTSAYLRTQIAQLIDKQNILGINESDVARTIETIANISFNKAKFIVTQSQALYLGYQRKLQIDEFGIQLFKYRGTTMKNTRQFCLFAMGKPSIYGQRKQKNIWTIRDINTWEKRNWQGKIPNVPLLVQAGGYRCRHAFIPHFGK